jgi:hypothetical protein
MKPKTKITILMFILCLRYILSTKTVYEIKVDRNGIPIYIPHKQQAAVTKSLAEVTNKETTSTLDGETATADGGEGNKENDKSDKDYTSAPTPINIIAIQYSPVESHPQTFFVEIASESAILVEDRYTEFELNRLLKYLCERIELRFSTFFVTFPDGTKQGKECWAISRRYLKSLVNYTNNLNELVEKYNRGYFNGQFLVMRMLMNYVEFAVLTEGNFIKCDIVQSGVVKLKDLISKGLELFVSKEFGIETKDIDFNLLQFYDEVTLKRAFSTFVGKERKKIKWRLRKHK